MLILKGNLFKGRIAMVCLMTVCSCAARQAGSRQQQVYSCTSPASLDSDNLGLDTETTLQGRNQVGNTNKQLVDASSVMLAAGSQERQQYQTGHNPVTYSRPTGLLTQYNEKKLLHFPYWDLLVEC